MIQLSRDIFDALARMAILNGMIKAEGDAADEAVHAEYRMFLPSMVDEFLPLIDKLIAAGLLTAQVDLAGREASKYSAIEGVPTRALDNGTIWLTCQFSGGTLRK